MKTTIEFCGAADTVTGSCYWIRYGGRNFLVDCGMFQGPKTLKSLNYEEFPFDPKHIDFVLLTHAHIDHSGLIPKLIKNGFTGPIYATEGTRDLLTFMLPDSGYIQESEVAHLNRRNKQRGLAPVTPIYTQKDAENAIKQFEAVGYEVWTDFKDGVRARYWNAGHILGSASIEIELAATQPSENSMRLLFSGDIGPEYNLFHPDPEGPHDLDYLVCESTYGDRIRETVNPAERRKRLAQVINQSLAGDGVLVIPAFSVERTQELLADISLLMKQKTIDESLVFLDSPLAIHATEVFERHAGALEDIDSNGDLFRNKNFVFTRTVEESKSINNYKSGVIIIAASGMCDAGRIRHHLKRRLWERNATILIIGFQAPGTLGSLLLEGKKAVRIQGEDIKVRAKIKKLDIYSGHADAEGLQEWVLARLPVHRSIFLTHGNPEALKALKKRLISAGLPPAKIIIPNLDDEFELSTKTSPHRKVGVKARLEPEAVTHLDWHNDFAQLSLDIRAALEKAADEKSRRKVIRRLRRALESERE